MIVRVYMEYKEMLANVCSCRILLGYTIDAERLHTSSEKVAVIQKAPTTHNQPGLRAFLGSLHYYGKSIPNLVTILYPFNKLLKKGTPWK